MENPGEIRPSDPPEVPAAITTTAAASISVSTPVVAEGRVCLGNRDV